MAKVSDEMLMAYADGELAPGERSEVENGNCLEPGAEIQTFGVRANQE